MDRKISVSRRGTTHVGLRLFILGSSLVLSASDVSGSFGSFPLVPRCGSLRILDVAVVFVVFDANEVDRDEHTNDACNDQPDDDHVAVTLGCDNRFLWSLGRSSNWSNWSSWLSDRFLNDNRLRLNNNRLYRDRFLLR